MEIWGGNRVVEDAVSVHGIDAWVLGLPHGGHDEGGDIHYVSMCGSGRITRFAVADVAGHGQSVAHLAGHLRDLMRKNINRVDQSRFARALNHEFGHFSEEEGLFATAILATYFAPNDHLICCNAGHPPPLWYRVDQNRWNYLEPDLESRARKVSNLPLGVIEPTDYHQFAVKLDKKDLVLIYTDSVLEITNQQGQRLNQDGLLQLVQTIDASRPELFNRALTSKLFEWAGVTEFEDDLTLLLLHHNAANPPLPGVKEMVRTMGKMMGLIKV
jgi:serine phosphatase RsbU (regulator of sigma subunit)